MALGAGCWVLGAGRLLRATVAVGPPLLAKGGLRREGVCYVPTRVWLVGCSGGEWKLSAPPCWRLGPYSMQHGVGLWSRVLGL